MVQSSQIKIFHGLDVNSNPMAIDYFRDKSGSRSPLLIADNSVIGRQMMVGNRRGFDYFTPSTSALVTSFAEFQNFLIQHQAGDSTLWQSTSSSGTRTQFTGSFAAPTGQRMDFTVGRGSLFMSTAKGPYKLDTITNTPIRAGINKGLDVKVTTTGTGGGFMTGNSRAAYHVTWIRVDANKQQIRGDVSSRVVINNITRLSVTTLTQSSGTATATTTAAHGFTTGNTILIAGAVPSNYNGSFAITVTGGTTFTYAVSGSPSTPATGTITAEIQLNTQVTFPAPWDVQTGDSYEVWRTITVDAAIADPGDNAFLVAATLYTGSAGALVTFTDTATDSLLVSATPLYTNAQGGQTATAGNTRPPFCQCLTTYKDVAIYANTAIDHQFTIDLLGVSNLVSGTSFLKLTSQGLGTVRTYTCGSSENTSTQQWQLVTSNLSISLNIQQSMQSFCRVVNMDSSGLWYAEYTSMANPNANPGIIRIWARDAVSGAFTIIADTTTTGNTFNPVIPTSGSSILSSNDARGNRIFFSKFQQPDAVPLIQVVDVGRLDSPIRRVITVRDACFIFKDDGVFYIDGLSAPFALHELDTTCHILAPWSARAVNNVIYCLSNQGVVQVALSGVTVISFNIEPFITPLLTLSNLSNVGFGVAYERDRLYILGLPTSASDTYCTQTFVFHTFIEEWTRWTKPFSAGLVLNSNLTLYLSSGIENAVLKQRNNGDFTDYSDEEQPISITRLDPNQLFFSWSNLNFTPQVGMSVHQGSLAAKVTAIITTGTNAYAVTLDSTLAFVAGAATVRLPIPCHIRTSPNIGGDSGTLKQFYNFSLILEQNTVTQATLELGTNEGSQFYSYFVTRHLPLGFGQNPWGLTTWGDTVSPTSTVPWVIDFPVPDNTGEAALVGFIHSVSQEQFNLAQVSLFYDTLSEIETASS